MEAAARWWCRDLTCFWEASSKGEATCEVIVIAELRVAQWRTVAGVGEDDEENISLT
jgi:hypothetical protein